MLTDQGWGVQPSLLSCLNVSTSSVSLFLNLSKPADLQRYLIRDRWKNVSTPTSCCLTLLSSNHVSEKAAYTLSFSGILLSDELSLSKDTRSYFSELFP